MECSTECGPKVERHASARTADGMFDGMLDGTVDEMFDGTFDGMWSKGTDPQLHAQHRNASAPAGRA